MSRAARLAVLVVPLLLLAGCEDAQPKDGPAGKAPTVSIPAGQTACSLLSAADIVPILQPAPPAPSPGAPSVTPVPVPKGTHQVATLSTAIGGAPQTIAVDQCIFSIQTLPAVVVSVYPPQKAGTVQFTGQVKELTDLTDNATPVTIGGGEAFLQQSAQAAALTIQGGNVVISIAYTASEASGGLSRAQKLANLGAAILHTAPPSLAAVAVAPGNSPAASATPKPAAGEKATGATAAATVAESDDLKFTPTTVSVKVGDVVEWDNKGSVPHNVTFSGQTAITSATMSGGDKYQVKFTTAGTYSYICTFHQPVMIGSVTVTG